MVQVTPHRVIVQLYDSKTTSTTLERDLGFLLLISSCYDSVIGCRFDILMQLAWYEIDREA